MLYTYDEAIRACTMIEIHEVCKKMFKDRHDRFDEEFEKLDNEQLIQMMHVMREIYKRIWKEDAV